MINKKSTTSKRSNVRTKQIKDTSAVSENMKERKNTEEITGDKNLILSKLQDKKTTLNKLEEFVNNVEQNPEFILENLFIENVPYNDFFEKNDISICQTQKYFLELLKTCEIFKNEHIFLKYEENFFPSNILVYYDEFAIFSINLVKHQYSFIEKELTEKCLLSINLAEKAIESSSVRGKQIVPIKSYIANNYNEVNKKFNNSFVARKKFFEFYFENKKYQQYFSYIKTKASFYLNFHKNQSKYIDEVLKVYDQVNETISKYDEKRENSQKTLKLLESKQKEIDAFARDFIKWIIKYNYNLR